MEIKRGKMYLDPKILGLNTDENSVTIRESSGIDISIPLELLVRLYEVVKSTYEDQDWENKLESMFSKKENE